MVASAMGCLSLLNLKVNLAAFTFDSLSSPEINIVIIYPILISGEMAIPQYSGRVTDWIINEEAPDAFTEAITIMTLMTIAR